MVLILAAALSPLASHAIDASNRYRSPRNPERQVRRSTELIVLHTTEAPAKSSLNKLSDRGEAHFCVTEEGSVYRIVDRDKEAFHAGRSMWNGKEDVDKFSIGIECVGHHDKPMPSVQVRAIRELVKELQSMYRLSDDKVVCHGHVAYGAPNKWHKFKHRGRKRCGMLFATPSLRTQLGLRARPAYDPDVRAKRLKNADDYLAKVLYGNADIMRRHYGAGVQQKVSPAATSGIFSWIKFGQKAAPKAKAVPQPKPAPKAKAVPQPKPAPKAGTFKEIPRTIADLRNGGYVARGSVTKEQTASKLVGSKWNAADTYYTIRNKVIPGNVIQPARIEYGMTIWTKK